MFAPVCLTEKKGREQKRLAQKLSIMLLLKFTDERNKSMINIIYAYFRGGINFIKKTIGSENMVLFLG